MIEAGVGVSEAAIAMTLAEKKALVGDFLDHCNRYADDKLAAYYEELRGSSGQRAEQLREKIRDWSVYRRFNEHALAELRSETLDRWFS